MSWNKSHTLLVKLINGHTYSTLRSQQKVVKTNPSISETLKTASLHIGPCKKMSFEALTHVYASVIFNYGIHNSFQTVIWQKFASAAQYQYQLSTSKKRVYGRFTGRTWLTTICQTPQALCPPCSSSHWKLQGKGKERIVSGKGQRQRRTGSVWLERVKVTPGFLCHDSLVFGLPIDDSLPFLWHLWEKIQIKKNQNQRNYPRLKHSQ